MKIAVCFSGQIRTGIQTYPNIKRFIGELWDKCDFFVHTWDSSYEKPTPHQVEEAGGYWNAKIHGKSNKQDIDFEKFKEIYNFTKIEITPFFDSNGNETCPGGTWQWYSWLHSINLKKQHEIENKIKYDYVVKIRPDIIYHESLSLANIINNLPVNSVTTLEELVGSHGEMSIDDVFYLTDSSTMDLIVSFVNTIQALPGGKSHQSMLYNHIIANGVKINNLNAGYFTGKYAVLRQQCISFCTITEFDKCEKMDKQIYYPTSRN
jgi:hypothetical protein